MSVKLAGQKTLLLTLNASMYQVKFCDWQLSMYFAVCYHSRLATLRNFLRKTFVDFQHILLVYVLSMHNQKCQSSMDALQDNIYKVAAQQLFDNYTDIGIMFSVMVLCHGEYYNNVMLRNLFVTTDACQVWQRLFRVVQLQASSAVHSICTAQRHWLSAEVCYSQTNSNEVLPVLNSFSVAVCFLD